MAENRVSSYKIKLALKEMHEKRPSYFITECKTCSTYFPDPQGLLIFDGLAVTKSYANPCITGYEIKISRQDFLQDNKWHLYLQYCNEFYFVVLNGLVKKGEIPDNTGLIYYNPETRRLRTIKKALYRKIEEPVGVYKYIIFSRLDEDRTPFYESRAEFAKEYLADKSRKHRLGKEFGGRLANDLIEAQERLSALEKTEGKLKLLDQLKGVLKKHDVGKYCWKDEELVKELDQALYIHYPQELKNIKTNLMRAMDYLDRIEKQYSAVSDEQ